MSFTCIRCLAETDNDCDICDDCIADSRKENGVEDVIGALGRLVLPSRAADELIFELVRGRKRLRSSFEQYEPSEKLPEYTSSLDAARQAVGDKWWKIEAGCDGLYFAQCAPWNVPVSDAAAGHGSNPAIALTMAALAAHRLKSPTPHQESTTPTTEQEDARGAT